MKTSSIDSVQGNIYNPQQFSGITQTITGVKKAGKYDGWLLLFLIAILLEGIFYEWLTPFIINRESFFFRLTPFLLYPTDLYLFPLTLFLMLLATPRRGVSGGMSRFGLLLVWWCLCIVGVIIGYFNHNPNLPADLRNLVVRPLISVAIYRLSLETNIARVLDRFIKFSILISLVLIIRRIEFFLGVDISTLPMGGWGVHVLLLPYSLLLMQIGTGEKRKIQWLLGLVIIALGILQDFWKPVVVGFLLLHVIALAFLVQGRGKSVSRRSKQNISRIILGLVVIGMIFGLFFLSNAYYLDLFKVRYLKESASVRDLSGNRFQIWSHALTIWRENPILGTGFGRLMQGFITDQTLGEPIYVDIYYVHNISLQILYQLGIIAFLIYVMLLIRWYFLIHKTLKNIKSTYETGIYLGIVVFIIIVFYIAQIGESMNNAVAGVIFWTAMGFETALASKLPSLIK
jgi:hypothetical protein